MAPKVGQALTARWHTGGATSDVGRSSMFFLFFKSLYFLYFPVVYFIIPQPSQFPHGWSWLYYRLCIRFGINHREKMGILRGINKENGDENRKWSSVCFLWHFRPNREGQGIKK